MSPEQNLRTAGTGSGVPAPGIPAPRATADNAAAPRGRDQYIDGLRALALVRVMAFHTFGWAWLPVLFPSMGVMFALAGSLVASSLDRAPGAHWTVLRKRVRRLLPPLWLYGAVLVALMSWQGWAVGTGIGTPLTWRSALNWVVPLSDPPGSVWGDEFVIPLWYVRTYLWLLLLSPMLLWLFRRHPVRMLAAPPLLLGLLYSGLVDRETPTGDTIEHLATFATCWMLGFAHHDGLLRRLPKGRSVTGGLLLMAAGLAYAWLRPDASSGFQIDDIAIASALYSAGAVLLLLRLYPARTFLDRMPRLSGLVSAMNARAMTIYLWGNLCIFSATFVVESNPWTRPLSRDDLTGQVTQFAAAWLVLTVVVLGFGWAEDLAAGRRPRINPWPRRKPAARKAAGTSAAGKPAATRTPGRGVWALGLALAAVLVGALVVGPAPQVSTAGTSAAPPLPVSRPLARTDSGTGGPTPGVRQYPVHLGVPTQLFWIGAVAPGASGEDAQSISSSWDSRWAQHYGGCDGIGPVGRLCRSDAGLRTGPGWLPTSTVPLENPYYVALPFNDLTSTGVLDRDRVPWSTDPGYAGRMTDRTVSFLKNRWVAVTGPQGTCYAQVEDTGPGRHDADYVFGDARPDGVGMTVSPAVARCVGLDPDATGLLDWQFVETPLAGPWADLITTRQVS